MTGVFDSGRGGLIALFELRRLRAKEDICFLRDRKNSPYGTKSEEELLSIVRSDISRLRAAGCKKILMACCTASTVYPHLSPEDKALCVPIIYPTALAAARLTKNKRIGVLATERTIASGKFREALADIDRAIEVTEISTRELVLWVENGKTDKSITDREKAHLMRLTEPFRKAKIDTLILGCTHFPALKGSIEACLDGTKTVSSAYIGALEMTKIQNEAGKGRLFCL